MLGAAAASARRPRGDAVAGGQVGGDDSMEGPARRERLDAGVRDGGAAVGHVEDRRALVHQGGERGVVQHPRRRAAARSAARTSGGRCRRLGPHTVTSSST